METKPQPVGVSRPVYQKGKEIARQIFVETMEEIEIRGAMMRKIKREADALVAGKVVFPLPRRPRVVAFGKAANRMAAALDDILGGQIEQGVVVPPAEPLRKLSHFSYITGGHPYPTAGSLAGAQAALKLLGQLTKEDVVIFLVSGGGSALFEIPLDPAVTLGDLAEFNRVLVTCGLPIEQINVLRKHLSAVKGGRLAVATYPAPHMTIFLSDVPEHLPSMVASGPTLPDESTVEDCYSIAAQHGLEQRFPASIRKHFEQKTLEETPKPLDKCFRNASYFCLLSNRDAVEAAQKAAERHGFFCEIDSNPWDEDYREVVGRNLAALDALAARRPGQPVALVAGGEVLCPVAGSGQGGRNQAYVLYAAQKIQGRKRVVLSAGTDGRDGNSPSSGAVADGHTISRARSLGLDPESYLASSDSYFFFRSLGDTIDVGFTDNNVRDVRIWMHFG